jgi:hypothetical protein
MGVLSAATADHNPSYLNPDFRSCYQKFCKDKNLEPNIVTFKSGIEGLWLGDPSAKYVFIYFHGMQRSFPC